MIGFDCELPVNLNKENDIFNQRKQDVYMYITVNDIPHLLLDVFTENIAEFLKNRTVCLR